MPIDARHPKEIRADIRAGRLRTVTAGLAPGFVQANLAVLPREQAYDFLLFCQRNPRPCPLIEVTDVGSPEPVGVARGADLRTDIPRYRIYKDGVLADEVTDVTPFWRDDLVAFLLGCSFTFEWALLDAGITVVTSAGNDGFAAMTGGSPGTGFGSLTIGASSTPVHERVLRDNQFGVGIGAPIWTYVVSAGPYTLASSTSTFTRVTSVRADCSFTTSTNS